MPVEFGDHCSGTVDFLTKFVGIMTNSGKVGENGKKLKRDIQRRII